MGIMRGGGIMGNINIPRSLVLPRCVHLEKGVMLILCHSLQTEASGGAEKFA